MVPVARCRLCCICCPSASTWLSRAGFSMAARHAALMVSTRSGGRVDRDFSQSRTWERLSFTSSDSDVIESFRLCE